MPPKLLLEEPLMYISPVVSRKIMTVYGTRPEAIKVAPIIKALDFSPHFESIPVVTGQHREMLDQVNELFGITPVRDLNIMSKDQSLNEIVAKVIAGIDVVYEELQPDAVIVQGDTSTVALGTYRTVTARSTQRELACPRYCGNRKLCD